ncbi:hypothetical protein LOZ65_004160 [Ophidiomyces ophidiicola]|nr:hypothetical protein LOZ65_004160 [Ophidiomyces ophidiicola]
MNATGTVIGMVLVLLGRELGVAMEGVARVEAVAVADLEGEAFVEGEAELGGGLRVEEVSLVTSVMGKTAGSDDDLETRVVSFGTGACGATPKDAVSDISSFD